MSSKNQDKVASTSYTGNNAVMAILAAEGKKPEYILTPIEKIETIRKGVSRNHLEQLKQKTGLDYDTLAKIFSVAKATLFNKKGEEKFNAALGEKIFSLADLYSYGYSVFEDKSNFNRWIEAPNKALGGEAPIRLLDTLYGVEEVKHLVGRIEYGVYS